MKQEELMKMLDNFMKVTLKLTGCTGIALCSYQKFLCLLNTKFIKEGSKISNEQITKLSLQTIQLQKPLTINKILLEAKSIYIIPLEKEREIIGTLYLDHYLEEFFFTDNVIKLIHDYCLEQYIHYILLDQILIRERLREESLLKELNQVQELREGDSFLISLLLNSLQSNNNSASNISVSFYIAQFKKFNFKKWSGEIGGDICKADTIYLNDNHAYTVFLNGDAMGKSIQGASGSIVLGAVFDAILSRAKSRRIRNYNLYPEAWLKETFLDIHHVFLSFQGFMMASFCLGLVHSETGLLYYINADHPGLIIYRDNLANFIDTNPHLYKIGTPEQEEYLSIRLFQLKDKDILISGSDGKDDLTIGYDQDGVIVNTDDALFLRTLEHCNCNIEAAYKETILNGKLMDDFSLLKLEFQDKHQNKITLSSPHGVYDILHKSKKYLEQKMPLESLEKLLLIENYVRYIPELSKLVGRIYYNKYDIIQAIEYFDLYNQSNPNDNLYIVSPLYLNMLEIMIQAYILLGDKAKAIECIEEYLYIDPAKNNLLYTLSCLYVDSKDFNKAADVGERLLLREEKNISILTHLMNIYIELKIPDRAIKLAKKALILEPENEEVLQVVKKVEAM